MKKTLSTLTLICVCCAGAAVAQDGGIRTITTPEGIVIEHDAPAEEFTRERPRKMKSADEAEAPTVAVAVAAAESAEPAAAEEKQEFVPKNEVTVIEKPAEEPKAAKAAAESEFENLFSAGARLGLGNFMGVAGYLKIPTTASQRIDAGVGLGFGIGKIASYVEGSVFYEWRFDVDDGILGWYMGPGVALGWYWGKEYKVPAPTADDPDKRDARQEDAFGLGVGAVLGLEVDLSFIDSDHALYTLKSMTVALDARPMVYSTRATEKKTGMVFVFTIGLSVRWVL